MTETPRLPLLALLLASLTLTGCELAGDIFEAGFVIGIVVVVLVVVLAGVAFRALKR